MTNLQQREVTMQQRAKQTTRREFAMDILSRYPFTLHRNQNTISIYPDNQRSCPVMTHKQFEEVRDALTSKWVDYDPNKTFFDNYLALFQSTPFSALYNYGGAENSDYAFSVYNSKNCYLSFSIIADCENIFYSFAAKEWCKNIFNSVQVGDHSENIYQSANVFKSLNIFFSKYIENCYSIRCSNNLISCQECLLCSGLENKSYCIENKQYSKEEYFIKKEEIISDKNMMRDVYAAMTQPWINHGSSNVQHCDFAINSEDIENGKFCNYIKSAKNILVVSSPRENRNFYNVFEAGAMGNKDFYNAINAGVGSEKIYNCEWIVTCSNCYYSRFLEHCSFCLWCIGLKNKSYCILNKQYSKEERYAKADEIFTQMEKDWQLWEFFPATMNPFYFNDTAAYLIDNSFTKEEVTKLWYLWRDEPIKVDIPEGAVTVRSSELSSYELRVTGADGKKEWKLDETVCKRVIIDENGDAYRIIPMELEFLQKHGLPLPRKHWLTRMKENFRIR